ncbi:oxidoreductase [Pediococcus stilesii]|uniref:Oxidoreductase n=2 Tax=Pediococcus stilesii TaxID=331679 RepID=A0A0R2KXI5_9LACO|nr:oxidoreductase [Pediococcus stilesii]
MEDYQLNKLMKAAVIEKYKQEMPEIRDVSIPAIRPNDVLVKVIATSINPIDIKTKDGGLKMLLKYEMPMIMGSDFAGIVVEAGEYVSDYKVGDAVFGRVQKDRIGTFAEYLVVDRGDIAPKPQNLSFEEAAAIPLVGLTSYQALHDIMNIQPGQKVMIQGGSGGIGTIAIQIAKYLGAYVATTTSEDNFKLVRSLGTDQLIDFRTQDFSEVLSGYDYVFDTRGGKTLEDAFKIVKPGGKIVSIAGLPNARFGKEYGVPFWKQLAFGLATRKISRLEKATNADYTFLFMKPSGAELDTLRKLIEGDIIKPIIDRVIPFSEIKEALNYSRSGRATGKIILKIRDEQVEEIN